MRTRLQIGYTLVELITVVVIMAVLAAITGPRFFDSGGADPFAQRGFSEQALAAVQFAQKFAIASGCDIRVTFDSGAGVFTIERYASADCLADTGAALIIVAQPGGGPLSGQTPSNVAITDLQIYFDRIGRPRDADPGGAFGALLVAAAFVSIGPRTLAIEPESGLTRFL